MQATTATHTTLGGRRRTLAGAVVLMTLVLDTELFEFICNENERSTQHMGPNIR